MIYIAWDRHGYATIRAVKKYLERQGRGFEDLGCTGPEENMRLEDMIPSVTECVLQEIGNIGIISCGTGVGVEVGANKFSGIRACLATSPRVAEWAVTYDRCNMLCLPGWEISEDEIHAILDAWFAARYDGDAGRLRMFETFDTWHRIS